MNHPIIFNSKLIGQSYSAKLYSASALALTQSLVETPANSGRYIATEAALVTAGLVAGTYDVTVDDGSVNTLESFEWDGTNQIATLATLDTKIGGPQTTVSGDIGTLDATLAVITNVLPSAGANMAGEGATAKNLDQVTVGTTQPRYNKEAGRAFSLQLSARNDGTHKATKPIRVRPGTVGSIAVSVDMSPVFGDEHVQTVGTPVVSSGTITTSALGPRDNKAMIQLAGTAVANETPTITVPVTMDTGEVVSVVIDVSVFAD